ncbi:hypothetical protein LF296_12800 [Acinetobacter vivianii]|uniref:Uncharacterized protein n=1 Tax=Acinetobacter vivianii TaxID=1776742 RepID=A0AAJ6P4A7_9GAMM|nr:hypothetical protein [Acinetobacter vivianii]WDZ50199.1 hypothetical protein LF296_12800 [Acinetobacter vivianii]
MNAIKKLSKEIIRTGKTTEIKKLPLLVFGVLIIFLVTIPALFIAGFSIGMVNFQNPFKAAVDLIEESL